MKKISTYDGARRLGIHPGALLFSLANIASNLEFPDVWPDVDEGWIDTIAIQKKIFPISIAQDIGLPKEKMPAISYIGLSGPSLHVLDKLRRHRKWGRMAVSQEALINLTHLSAKNLHEAIDELRKRDFLDRNGLTNGKISLNSSKKREIEEVKTG